MKAFISYSHKDQEYLSDLLTHLAQIKRQGLLQEWTDHEIHAGAKFNDKIFGQLESSQFFIALVSPHYIASNYCYEKEFEKALDLQKVGRLKIIPIICRPCEWKHTPFTDFKALPKDGKAISDWQNQDSAYFDITQNLRTALQSPVNLKDTGTVANQANPEFNTGSNAKYKVRKDFDKIQKIEFVDNSFKDIKDKLKEYLHEISGIENVRYKVLTDDNSQFVCVLVNRDMGIAESQLTFRKMSEQNNVSHFNLNDGDFTFVFQQERNEETVVFVLSYDEYKLFFSRRNYAYSREQENYTAKGIADELWKIWLRKIGIDMANN